MKIAAAIALAAVLAGAAWTLWAWHETTFRYRLTVEVASGGQHYTGSGVIQVQIGIPIVALNGIAATPRVTGDAVVVDVPGRSPLFVLLTAQNNSDWDATIAFKVFRDRLASPQGKTSSEMWRDDTATLVHLREKAEVPPDRYPLMVAFRDINRPDSVYQVYPRNLSPPLEPGASVVRMTIEMTDAPVTHGIEERLPWLTNLGGTLAGTEFSFSSALPSRLGAPAFRKRGI